LKFSITCLALLLAATFAIARVKPSAAGKPDDFFTNLAIQHARNVEHRKRADLISFFDRYKCPAENYKLITPYLDAATKYQLDWRILPAISLQESTCLKHYPGDTNNPFGFGSSTGLYRFASIPAGIDYVTGQLANGSPYAQKTTLDKIATYGPHSNPQYAPEVYKYMREIESNP
jgi:hypothetical protein